MLSLAHSVSELGEACPLFAVSASVPTRHWYALRVRTRSEWLAASALESKGFETFCPTYPARRRYSDRIQTVQTVAFPGYVFCRFPPSDKTAILSTQGVDSIVSIARKMAPIPDVEIEQVKLALAHGAEPTEYKVGQRVRVECGSFAGCEGELISVKGSDELIVSITLLQRSVSLQIDRDQVRALHQN